MKHNISYRFVTKLTSQPTRSKLRTYPCIISTTEIANFDEHCPPLSHYMCLRGDVAAGDRQKRHEDEHRFQAELEAAE